MFYRSISAALVVAAALAAAPQLTTIQDVLYKADGTKFNGVLVISWTSFEAADSSQIVTQSKTVTVTDGNLQVQLAPSTTSSPAIYYNVKYNSDGRIQFTETWAVPSSSQPVRVRDVRIESAADTNSGGESTSVNEADVVGLIADLGARPLKGPGYAAGRVAVVNAGGEVESVSGSASDCVRVDGTSGPCGGQTASFVDGDSPSGIVDGANTIFTLSNLPNPAASVAVYRNGLLQKIVQDYTLDGRTLQFAAAATPQPGDTLLVSYRIDAGGDTGTSQIYPAPQVLCSGTGAATTGTGMSSMGSCTIPGGLLIAGDRVEIHFDLEHAGSASGFSFQVLWGGTTVTSRDATSADSLVTGRADAGIVATGARLSSQTWGGSMAFGAGVANSTDSYAAGLVIDIQGMLAQSGDTLRLGNFTVVRFP